MAGPQRTERSPWRCKTSLVIARAGRNVPLGARTARTEADLTENQVERIWELIMRESTLHEVKKPGTELTMFLINSQAILKREDHIWVPSHPPGNGYYLPPKKLVPCTRVDCFMTPDARDSFWSAIVEKCAHFETH